MKPLLTFALLCPFVLNCAAPRPESPAPRARTAMTLTSSAFADGQPMPRTTSGEGGDNSPALAWEGVPAGTRSFALVCRDPDAPSGTFIHWVVYNIPDSVRALGSGIGTDRQLPNGAVEGENSNGVTGYMGPMPPPGKPHRYYFTIYALDTMLPVESGVTARRLDQMMQGHVLGTGRLFGTYHRR